MKIFFIVIITPFFFCIINTIQESNKMAIIDDTEAIKSLQLALKMKKALKYAKAKKLMEHAMAVKPNHPDVLNHYAELLEEENIVEADRLYTKALVLSPDHEHAVRNIQRTGPVVEAMDKKELERVDAKFKDVLNLDLETPSFKNLENEMYFQQIHHTLAIEGNTMSLNQTKTVTQTKASIAEKSSRENNEVFGLQSALEFVQTLKSNPQFASIPNLLHIHQKVLQPVDPKAAGVFRNQQVYVGVHVPPPATEVKDLTEKFIKWLNSTEARDLHPVKRAAVAHHKFAYIHPFVDGNGRTARLLMNLILMNGGYPPVVIRKQDKDFYFEMLQMATEGDVRPLVRFLVKCVECILDVYLSCGVSEDCLKVIKEKMDGQMDVITL